jgi:broad specificity phosphatase PhoE
VVTGHAAHPPRSPACPAGVPALPIPLLARPFVFLRHGETTSNRDALIAGSLDVELTALGREQARQAGDRLALRMRRGDERYTPIVASSRRRARETACIVAQALDFRASRILSLPDLDERYWGALEGRPRSERRDDALPADMETADAFLARVSRGLAAVPLPAADCLPLIAAHSGVWRMLCRLIGIRAAAAPIGNAVPMRISPAPDGWVVEPL